MTGIPGKVAPYVYNKIVLPEEEDDYYAHLVEWKAAADIPVHVTEYHFWAHNFFDPSNLTIADRAYEDNRTYKKLGMNGMMHYITMHNAFPNGYAYYLNARHLFDNSVKIEDIKEDYFSHAYGEHYDHYMTMQSVWYIVNNMDEIIE